MESQTVSSYTWHGCYQGQNQQPTVSCCLLLFNDYLPKQAVNTARRNRISGWGLESLLVPLSEPALLIYLICRQVLHPTLLSSLCLVDTNTLCQLILLHEIQLPALTISLLCFQKSPPLLILAIATRFRLTKLLQNREFLHHCKCNLVYLSPTRAKETQSQGNQKPSRLPKINKNIKKHFFKCLSTTFYVTYHFLYSRRRCLSINFKANLFSTCALLLQTSFITCSLLISAVPCHSLHFHCKLYSRTGFLICAQLHAEQKNSVVVPSDLKLYL